MSTEHFSDTTDPYEGVSPVDALMIAYRVNLLQMTIPEGCEVDVEAVKRDYFDSLTNPS